MRPMRIHKLLFVSLVALAPLAACSDDPAGSDTGSTTATDTAGDVDELEGKSAFHIEVVVDDEIVDLGVRDITDQRDKFSFGSAHIAPAVSFAMTDDVNFPRKVITTIDFGIVVPSPEFPIATEGTGTYAFEEGADPSIEVFVKGLQYRSTNVGASGSVVVTDWAVDTGGLVAGTFEGTLVSDGASGKTLTVEGWFHFILPTKGEGQPQ